MSASRVSGALFVSTTSAPAQRATVSDKGVRGWMVKEAATEASGDHDKLSSPGHAVWPSRTTIFRIGVVGAAIEDQMRGRQTATKVPAGV